MIAACFALVVPMMTPMSVQPDDAVSRPRIRDLGVSPGSMAPGPRNAITDVAGVLVGHHTILEGDSIRTGVTAILPHAGNLFQRKVPAAVHVGNGFGKAAGLAQVIELGTIETPIVLTNTLAVGTAVHAVVQWTLAQEGNEHVTSVNAVVGECNDSYLNDIRAMRITADDVIAAIETARDGEIEEGNVGAGAGTRCFGFKGGIGTSSRLLTPQQGGYVVGAIVQSNYGGDLVIDGRRAGEALRGGRGRLGESSGATGGDGSCMIVIATDAPLEARQLERIARRAVLGLARTGSVMAHGSGDFIIAFSTARSIPHQPQAAGGRTQQVELLHDQFLTPLFQATVEAVEEAVYNSLTRAEMMTGHEGRTAEAIPIDALRELLR
jgi:D-aminopeptidase